MGSNLAKEARQMVAALEDRGYRAAIEGGHWKIRDPRTGASLVTIALTPSDQRFWKNKVSELKKVTDSTGRPLLDRDPRGSTTPKKEERGMAMSASAYVSDRQVAEKRAVQEVLRGGLARVEFARHVFDYANEHARVHERRFTNPEGAHWHVRQLLIDKKVPEWALRWIGRAANDILDVPTVEVAAPAPERKQEDPFVRPTTHRTIPWTELEKLRGDVERATKETSVLSFSRLVADKMGVPVGSARSHVRRLLNKENVNEGAVGAITSVLYAYAAEAAPAPAPAPAGAETPKLVAKPTLAGARMKPVDIDTLQGLRRIIEEVTEGKPVRNGREFPYGTWPEVGRAAAEAARQYGVDATVHPRGKEPSKPVESLIGDRIKAAVRGKPVTRQTREIARALVRDWARQREAAAKTEGPLAEDVRDVIEKAREAQPHLEEQEQQLLEAVADAQASMPAPAVTTFPEEWLDSTATDELPLHLRALTLMLRSPEDVSPSAAMQLAMEIMRLEVAARQH